MKVRAADPLVPPDFQGRLWVAYSGGLDSSVLLHRLARQNIPGLSAVHVHHGLQAAADDWVGHCRRVCREFGVPLRVLKVRVARDHEDGPEAAAREVRYSALRKLLKPGELLATAHHQDDQAETLLLRLLRGTGIAGLAGIREYSGFARGALWRPLLQTPRGELHDYASRHGLHWIEDPHNRDLRFARSYLRAEILPRLRLQWPQAVQSLARTARLAGEAERLLEDLAVLDLQAARSGEAALDVKQLLSLVSPRRNNLLRHWLHLQGWNHPPAEVLARLETEVLQAKADAQPLLHCGEYEFRRYRDRLFVMAPLPDPPPRQPLRWRGMALELPEGCGRLRNPRPVGSDVTVSFPRGGERIRLAADAPARSLKNLFQERGVPPWARSRLPLIYRAGELQAVGDLWRTEAAKSSGLRPRWTHKIPGLD